MYQPGMGGGGGCALSGCVLLPNTGGNTILTVIAISAIAVGSAIVLSTIARMIAKKAFTKA